MAQAGVADDGSLDALADQVGFEAAAGGFDFG
jgi:hypothetical protein